MNKYFQHLVDQNGRALFTYQVIAVWMGLVIEVVGLLWILGTLLFAYFTTLHHSNASETALETKHIAYPIEGMTCASCSSRIEKQQIGRAHV